MSLSSYLKSIIAERKNKMTLEEVKQKLKAFDKYTFEEDTHTYYCNGKRVGIGVTTLIGLYANKFDEQKVAEMVAQKQNKEVSKILEEWHYKRDFSCEKVQQYMNTLSHYLVVKNGI